MFLAIDVGNTNVTLGVFDGESLRATWRLATDIDRLADEYGSLLLSLVEHSGLSVNEVEESAMTCVVPELEPVFETVCSRYFGVVPLVVGVGTRTGLKVLYDTPRDVGADRVVDAVAAIRDYGPPPLIVVDIGTATVFDAVSADGDYLGGAIAPGPGIAFEALIRRAAKLYRVEFSRPESAIGRNTVSALQSGIIFGYVGLVEGIVARMKDELGGQAKVIGTGGYAPIIARETNIIDAVDADLTLKGLRIVYDMNSG
ncbi:MAG TPA: type III pantothenate kinase [Dehalococcoidia bacterium]|jgi:type III pantothenate kinase|nr:type III pantothenate kinase [Dehalococcoidia bacterium]